MKRNLFKIEIESNVSSIFISKSNSLFSVEGLARQIRSSKEILAFRTELLTVRCESRCVFFNYNLSEIIQSETTNGCCKEV